MFDFPPAREPGGKPMALILAIDLFVGGCVCHYAETSRPSSDGLPVFVWSII
jgi:hypothetical protein